MSTIIRSNTTRFAIATVLTLATATGALAASRGENAQAAREAAALRNQAAYGAYAAAPAPVLGGSVYAPQTYSVQADGQYLDQAKGHID
ncbi:MAG: hypothetical protein HXX10_26850 [Rhodoplanes sp.]|uniref:hypothetical protein n=1 Tax=Rhodoplanes sp. TaxID=1968906 RepID=UPI0018012E92|nr:hypothetical protein [Rhodoplanes sp.]NVO17659.1 hypothetical protein [Rhodoplanes sp.]